MTTMICEKAGLFAPAMASVLSVGTLEADSGALIFRGTNPVPELRVDGVHRVWTESFLVHIDYADGRTVAFADYTHGPMKAPRRRDALEQGIRAALGMPAPPVLSAQQRARDTAAAWIPKGPAKMQTARTWMLVGGVFFGVGLIWALAADEVSGYAIGAMIIGALRFLAGVAEYHDGRKMAEGRWVPRALRIAAQQEAAAEAAAAAPSIRPAPPEPHVAAVPAAAPPAITPATPVTSAPPSPAPPPPPPPFTGAAAGQPRPPRPTALPAVLPAAHPASRSRALWTAVGAAALVAFAIGAFLLVRAWAPRPGSPTTPVASVTQPTATGTATPGATSSEPMPEDTVDALYAAAGRGDLTAARATFAPGSDLAAGALEGWGSVRHSIEMVTAGSREGEIKIEVHETGDGFPDTDIVTYTLVNDSGEWKISGWFAGRYMDEPGFGEGAVVNPQISRDEQAAVETLSSFLTHRVMGAVGDMKKLATAHMKSSQPKVFVMQYGDFTSWSITDARTEGAAIVLTVDEIWKGTTQTHEYTLVKSGGHMLVDERR